uniref:Gamma-butyrobetaine dioxygenase n=1 Tax=Ganoderma boninense TaxID=34458 RepID=A0A5K1K317_9APHY|nr:Gamma-butyrobetaine dioxygenase [Ganoderma boninense]
MFADEMDILSLSRWRGTCRTNYHHASFSMRRSLTSRIRAFTPYPQELVDTVTRYGAVIGGELALSFFLRNETYEARCLDIYASHFHFEKLCDELLHSTSLQPHIAQHSVDTHSLYYALRRLVSASLVIRLHNSRVVYVHRSYTCSSSAPLTRAPCTALSNFVTGFSFGCSHPELTLAHRALLADRELVYLSTHDANSLNHLLSNKFSLAVAPTAWADYRRDMIENSLRNPEECWRERHICPKQGRFFGDRGSLVGYFDPLGNDEDRCTRGNIAPFGAMAVWRLMSSFECEGGCEHLDEVLDYGVTSIPVLFRKDPYGDLLDCILDKRLGVSPLYPRPPVNRALSSYNFTTHSNRAELIYKHVVPTSPPLEIIPYT